MYYLPHLLLPTRVRIETIQLKSRKVLQTFLTPSCQLFSEVFYAHILHHLISSQSLLASLPFSGGHWRLPISKMTRGCSPCFVGSLVCNLGDYHLYILTSQFIAYSGYQMMLSPLSDDIFMLWSTTQKQFPPGSCHTAYARQHKPHLTLFSNNIWFQPHVVNIQWPLASVDCFS